MSTPLFPTPPVPSPYRPSLFELIAQEQLRDLLHPVVRYILTYFVHRYPRYLLRILNNHEEFFALLLLILERHHLKRHNASLSEYFYKLRLAPVQRISTPRLKAIRPTRASLNRRQRWGLLFFLVGIPYIRARAQDYYDRLGGGQDPDNLPEDTIIPTTTAQRLFKSLYPYVNLGVDLTFLGYDLAYMFDKTDYYRPWQRMLGVRIERRGPEDEGEDTNRSIFDSLPPLIPPLLLLLKFSSWWYSPTSPRTLASSSSTGTTSVSQHASILPPKPLPILPSSGILSLVHDDESAEAQEPPAYTVTNKSFGDCPLCGKKWQNPAVLPSGWVVCWRCGWDALEGDEGSPKCPITGVDVGPGELRRVLV